MIFATAAPLLKSGSETSRSLMISVPESVALLGFRLLLSSHQEQCGSRNERRCNKQ